MSLRLPRQQSIEDTLWRATGMSKHFVGERIEPIAEAMDTRRMAAGEPGLPMRFRWRGEEHAIAEVLEQWRQTGPCTSGSDEEYVRKHWYRVRTTGGAEMTLYFERQPRSARELKSRWWLHTLSTGQEGKGSVGGYENGRATARRSG